MQIQVRFQRTAPPPPTGPAPTPLRKGFNALANAVSTEPAAIFRNKRARVGQPVMPASTLRPPPTDAVDRPAGPPALAGRAAAMFRPKVASLSHWVRFLERDNRLARDPAVDPGGLMNHAIAFCGRNALRLPNGGLGSVFHAYGAHVLTDGTPAEPPTREQLDFVTQQLIGRDTLSTTAVTNIALGLPFMVGRDGAPGLLVALADALEASDLRLKNEECHRLLCHLKHWRQIPPSPERDRVLTLLTDSVRRADPDGPMHYLDLLNGVKSACSLAPDPIARALLAAVTQRLTRHPPDLAGQDCDGVLKTLSYLFGPMGDCPELREFLAVLTPLLRDMKPAGDARHLIRVCKNLRRLPPGPASADFIAAVTPWIRRSGAHPGSQELMAMLRGIHEREDAQPQMKDLAWAIGRKLASIPLGDVNPRTLTTAAGHLASLPESLITPYLSHLLTRMVECTRPPLDLMGIATACHAMAHCKYWINIPRITRALLAHLRVAAAGSGAVEVRHLTMILQSLREQRDSDEGSEMAQLAAGLLARTAQPPEVADLRAWTRCLEGLGRTPGAYAIADALLALIRRSGHADSPEIVQRLLHAARAIPDSALARHALASGVRQMASLRDLGVVGLLQFLAIHPQPQGPAILEAATARIQALHAAGELGGSRIPTLVTAFSMIDPGQPLPACLQEGYEEGVRAMVGGNPPSTRERRLLEAMQRALAPPAAQGAATARAAGLRWQANTSYLGIEMDLFFPALWINVEWDGKVHRLGEHGLVWERARDAFLRSQGIEVLRIVVDGDMASVDDEEVADRTLATLQQHLAAREAAAREAHAALLA